jgi:hypothetical protein
MTVPPHPGASWQDSAAVAGLAAGGGYGSGKTRGLQDE